MFTTQTCLLSSMSIKPSVMHPKSLRCLRAVTRQLKGPLSEPGAGALYADGGRPHGFLCTAAEKVVNVYISSGA